VRFCREWSIANELLLKLGYPLPAQKGFWSSYPQDPLFITGVDPASEFLDDLLG
jgi:hypothetical protein